MSVSRLVAAVAALRSVLVVAQSGGGAQAQMCFGRAATHFVQPGVAQVGTSGSDVIIGTRGDDVIRGRGGDDRICAKGGDDQVWGNRGDDRINLVAGDDWARGGKGRDTIRGKRGRDELDGGGGVDRVAGGKGRDIIIGGERAGTLLGGSANDRIRGRGAVDVCVGGSGNNDRLFSCNEADPFVGERSGIDVDGSFQTLSVVSTGDGTYSVVLRDTANGGCGLDDDGKGIGSISTGIATSSGDTLTFDYTTQCVSGDRPDLMVLGREFILRADGSLVNAIDGARFA